MAGCEGELDGVLAGSDRERCEVSGECQESCRTVLLRICNAVCVCDYHDCGIGHAWKCSDDLRDLSWTGVCIDADETGLLEQCCTSNLLVLFGSDEDTWQGPIDTSMGTVV